MLVCLAAAIAMIQANVLLDQAGKRPDSFVVLDLMRLPLGPWARKDIQPVADQGKFQEWHQPRPLRFSISDAIAPASSWARQSRAVSHSDWPRATAANPAPRPEPPE